MGKKKETCRSYYSLMFKVHLYFYKIKFELVSIDTFRRQINFTARSVLNSRCNIYRTYLPIHSNSRFQVTLVTSDTSNGTIVHCLIIHFINLWRTRAVIREYIQVSTYLEFLEDLFQRYTIIP